MKMRRVISALTVCALCMVSLCACTRATYALKVGENSVSKEIYGYYYSVAANSDEYKDEEDKETIMPIVLACMDMARSKEGALIVIERAIRLDDIVDTGDRIDANINQRLIENIFFKNSPLHDGAIVISNKRIKAARCILPVSHSHSIPKELGLRHRAAMGISQDSDAIAIVCSEETGRISVAIKGEFHLRLSAEELEGILGREMKV